jgi:hypothetical protein
MMAYNYLDGDEEVHFSNEVDLREWINGIRDGLRVSCVFAILHVNIRSLLCHWDELLIRLGDILHDIDVLILTETSIKKDVVDMYHIPNYDVFTFWRDKRRGVELVYMSGKI